MLQVQVLPEVELPQNSESTEHEQDVKPPKVESLTDKQRVEEAALPKGHAVESSEIPDHTDHTVSTAESSSIIVEPQRITDGPPPAEGSPAKGPPPAEAPPAQAPPVVEGLSVVEGPPAEGPPAEGPPAEGPPAEGPPAEGPPAEGPPVEGPKASVALNPTVGNMQRGPPQPSPAKGAEQQEDAPQTSAGKDAPVRLEARTPCGTFLPCCCGCWVSFCKHRQ